MVTMTPSELAEYLTAIKTSGAARADVVLGPDRRIVVEFAPALPVDPLPGEVPDLGAWKEPLRLDDPASLWPAEPGPEKE